MPCLISGGKISAVVFEGFVQTEASFYVAPPFDGEILLPFIPKGIIYDLKITVDGAVVSETKAVNIRQFNAMPLSNCILISRRIDGGIVLKINNTNWNTPVEVRVGCIAHISQERDFASLTFPSGYGESVMADVSVKVLDNSVTITSPTHKITASIWDKTVNAEACADINGGSAIFNISRNAPKKASVLISRRLFGDNLAYCTFSPTVGNRDGVNYIRIEPIGGIGVKILNGKAEYKFGEYISCFAIHSVIPPKGMRITDENGGFSEEIYFESVSSNLMFMPVELMYAKEKAEILQAKMENAPFEERCIIREEINDICIKHKMAMGDIALLNITDGQNCGMIGGKQEEAEDSTGFLFENAKVSPYEVVGRILNSQTIDGAIAEIELYEETALVFSTAVCLIALRLYTEDKYSEFAKRSIEFLKGKSGYWANTALKLWSGEAVDVCELAEKSDMKIMYRRLDELAVSIIKNFRRK